MPKYLFTLAGTGLALLIGVLIGSIIFKQDNTELDKAKATIKLSEVLIKSYQQDLLRLQNHEKTLLQAIQSQDHKVQQDEKIEASIKSHIDHFKPVYYSSGDLARKWENRFGDSIPQSGQPDRGAN